MKGLFLWISQLNNNFWSRISKSTDADVKSLGVYRIIVGLSLLTLNFQNVSWVGYSPQAFFKPPVLSVAYFFKGFPSPSFFIGIEVILTILALFITLGIKTRLSIVFYIISSLIALNLKYSLGKINHDEIMTYAALFCMSFSGCGHELALVPDKTVDKEWTKKSLSLLSVLLCFGFFSAGFEKVVGWIKFDFNLSGSAGWFYPGYYVLEKQYLLAPIAKHLPFWAFKIMDFLVVPFELSSFFFLLSSKKAWRIWLILACSFHMGNTLILNINFISLSVVYLAFINYSKLYPRIKYFVSLKYMQVSIFCLLSLIVIFRIKNSLSSISIKKSFDDNLYIGYLYFTIIFWLLIMTIIYKSTFSEEKEYQRIPEV